MNEEIEYAEMLEIPYPPSTWYAKNVCAASARTNNPLP